MPRLSLLKRLSLGLTQQEVDFVDINLRGDTPLFLDPYFIGLRTDFFSFEASRTIRSFFEHFLVLIRSGREDEAFDLFSHLDEPNETGLGLSRGKSKGRGVGPVDSRKIFESLKRSRAVQTGLVEHIEDCRLFVSGIDKDKTSDMTTNIIRRHLIEYTQIQCKNHKVALTSAPSGFMWEHQTKRWETRYIDMLVVDGRKLLLVPKALVSYSDRYTASKYYQHFILEFLKHEHLRLGTALVETKKLKSGEVKKFVLKKRLRATVAPQNKSFIEDFTVKHKDVLQKYRKNAVRTAKSLTNDELARSLTTDVAKGLADQLQQLQPGPADATGYEKVIAATLELLFYPNLINPEIQVKIHGGRKRIDVAYDNAASKGFFHRLHTISKIPCQFVFVECKNYNSDPANPELDQLSGRFSANRGTFGLLVCRAFEDLETLLQRCTDTFRDSRGLVIPVSDVDILIFLNQLRDGDPVGVDDFLQQRYKRIALR